MPAETTPAPIDLAEALRLAGGNVGPRSGAMMERMADEIERLREMLKHADQTVVWECTATRSGFQEEIEHALGII